MSGLDGTRSYALFKVSAAMLMRSALFWDFMWHHVFTEVSGKCIGPIFKGQEVQESP
jgi:hypothetical protein